MRRLRLPLPLARRFCPCDRLLDSFGHHRASCARAGVLGRRGHALESAAARVCCEAGARVTTNVLVRDLDLGAPEATGARRLEVVADGLPLFGGAQLAVDTTLSALHCDGSARPGAAHRDGVALEVARRRKERTHPEMAPWSRCRLMVMANEVGGRWSPEALAFLRQLAKAKAHNEPDVNAASGTTGVEGRRGWWDSQCSPCLCEASPAEGRRRFTQTRLVPAFRVSTGLHVEHRGRRCSHMKVC